MTKCVWILFSFDKAPFWTFHDLTKVEFSAESKLKDVTWKRNVMKYTNDIMHVLNKS